MFSSNQILEVSGCLSHAGELLSALEFALKFSDNLASFSALKTKADIRCVYQITDDGRYCIGKSYGEPKTGWNEFPFDFDLDIIAAIIAKHLAKQEIKYGVWDGSYDKGFLMKVIEDSFADEENGIKNPSCGIVEFSPYTCFYAK
jgi:hypothetical protein